MADLSTSLPPWLVGLTVCGGVDPETYQIRNFSRNKIVKCGRRSAPLLLANMPEKNTNKSAERLVTLKTQQTTPCNSSKPQTTVNDISTFLLMEHLLNSEVLEASIKNI